MLVASQLEKLWEDLDKKVLVAGEAAAGEVGQEEGNLKEWNDQLTLTSHRTELELLLSPLLLLLLPLSKLFEVSSPPEYLKSFSSHLLPCLAAFSLCFRRDSPLRFHVFQNSQTLSRSMIIVSSPLLWQTTSAQIFSTFMVHVTCCVDCEQTDK